ncbi:MAG: L-glutamate gamma-semialdehyde dehydrogenase [Chloroflexota bacterium]|nr:MAG: L-glutamate gamma-semialdehyde dehydrogenase [Chloroflexota bacterium]
MLPAFRNEPLTDFSRPENVQAFRAALEKVKAEIGQTYPLVLGGHRVTGSTFPSINPSRPGEILGHFVSGTKEHAETALEAAQEAFKTWQFTPAEARARCLLRAAADMRRRKHEFSATMVLEVGKSWAEADADTAEAIDFMEYYARQAIRIADVSHMLTPYAPEQLSLTNIPLGVGLIIPPWNFPLAIPTGMVSAAIVSGNAIIFKPASQSPWIAYKLAEALWNGGVPGGVLNFLSGPGSSTGGYLVSHPQIRFIGFTGSKEVGIWIHENAAKVQPGQIWLKRTILEMGGKDAVLVDETADLEQAAQGIVVSAFGFQGQKCSAGSRAIIVNEVYEQVVSRVVELAEQITVGAPDIGPEVWMGPVVDSKSMQTIMDYIEVGTQEGKLLTGGHRIETPDGGYFLPPTIFGDVPPDARIALEEIFGPVLSVIRARDYDDALKIANGTEFGLTGAVYSTDHERLERARREFHVGNLYFNRKCTGALVGVHPFGGFNMSGTDSKAGGPDYLLLFTQQKSVAERL